MVEVGALEAKNKFGSLLDDVERGEEIIITRHGRPVARRVSNEPWTNGIHAREAADRIRARATSLPEGMFDGATFKKDRDAGRP